MSLEVVRAGSVRDAAAILAANAGARLVAGGTLVVRDVNCGDLSIDTLVLADGLGLDRITVVNGRAEIGAAVTMAELAKHPNLPFLRPVVLSIGGPAVRGMATVGGNLFARSPYGDFGVALLALGAKVALEDGEGTRSVDLERFFEERDRQRGRIVKSVAFTLPPDGAFRFAKPVRRHSHGAAVLSIAAVLPVVDGRVREPKVAYGAMAPTPIRAQTVEAGLQRQRVPLDAVTIRGISALATEGCAPASDPFASAWYRQSVLSVHLARLLAG